MADDPQDTFNASDEVANNNAKREAARVAREDLDVLRLLMHTKPGRAFLYRRLLSCHIYSSTFMPGQSDVTAFQLGEENIGKKLMLDAQSASIDLYLQMVKEAQAEESRLADVRKTEERNRQEREEPTTESTAIIDLPPPAGYPGGPPLPKDKNKGKSQK